MSVSFDGANQVITLSSAGTYNVETDLYSEWKEWVLLSDNAKFLPAFDTTGGDSIGSGQEIAPYFFLRTDLGWVIKAPEEDGEVLMLGNLFPRSAGQALFEAPDGNFTVLIKQSLSSQAIVVNTGGSALTSEESSKLLSLGTPAETADAVWDENMSGHSVSGSAGATVQKIDSNTKLIPGTL